MAKGKDRTIGAAVISGLTVIIAALITVVGPDIISGSDSPAPETAVGDGVRLGEGRGNGQRHERRRRR
jgi:hypothetical protein